MRQRTLSCRLYWALPAAIMALGLGGRAAAADPPIQAMTQGGLVGSKQVKARKGGKPDSYKWTVFFGFPADNADDIPAGGMATFGYFDPGEVMLITHIEYAPNLSSGSYGRDLYPDGYIFDKAQLPRYLMTCAWPQEEGQPPSAMIHAYAERDDANFIIKDHGSYLYQSARWVPVPPKRAEGKFAAHDYCGELAATKNSSAPSWLPQSRYR